VCLWLETGSSNLEHKTFCERHLQNFSQGTEILTFYAIDAVCGPYFEVDLDLSCGLQVFFSRSLVRRMSFSDQVTKLFM